VAHLFIEFGMVIEDVTVTYLFAVAHLFIEFGMVIEDVTVKVFNI
jgi:hypothetical protein